MDEEIQSLKEAEKVEPQAGVSGDGPERRPHGRHSHQWIPGLALIILGVVFLLGNLTGTHLDNWWALFILIPAVANLGNVLGSFRRHGRLNRSARGSLTGALILTLVAFTFLLNLDWGLIWPVFLIIGGVAALLNNWFS